MEFKLCGRVNVQEVSLRSKRDLCPISALEAVREKTTFSLEGCRVNSYSVEAEFL